MTAEIKFRTTEFHQVYIGSEQIPEVYESEPQMFFFLLKGITV
jgi:hypothetical protein